MTSIQVRIRHDTATNCDAATGASGELAYDTTNKRVRAHDASLAGGYHIPNHKDVQHARLNTASSVSGTNTITLTFSPATIDDSAPSNLFFTPANTNTGATTVAVDGRTAVDVKKYKNGSLTALEAGDLVQSCPAHIIAVGSNYILLNPQANTVSAGLTLLQATSFSAQASIEFDSSVITSSYDRYVIKFNDVYNSTQTGNAAWGFAIYASGAYLTSNYAANNDIGSNSSMTGTRGISMTGADAVTSIGGGGMGNDSTHKFHGELEFSNPSASATPYFTWDFGLINASAQVKRYSGSGGNTGTAAMSKIKFWDTANQGQSWTGKARLYGYQAS